MAYGERAEMPRLGRSIDVRERVFHGLVERRCAPFREGLRCFSRRFELPEQSFVCRPFRLVEARPRASLVALHTAPEAGGDIPPPALRIDRRESGQAVRSLQIVLDLEPDLEAISVEPFGL